MLQQPECSRRLVWIRTTDLNFRQEGVCYTTLRNHSLKMILKRVRIWGFYCTANSETQICYESKLWEPESGTYDKQKVKLTYLILFFEPKVTQYGPSSHPV